MAKRNPTSLKLSDLVEVLQKSGSKAASKETADAVLEEAPRNQDGTFNLIHVIAWLIDNST